jgi:hypothetical protein
LKIETLDIGTTIYYVEGKYNPRPPCPPLGGVYEGKITEIAVFARKFAPLVEYTTDDGGVGINQDDVYLTREEAQVVAERRNGEEGEHS